MKPGRWIGWAVSGRWRRWMGGGLAGAACWVVVATVHAEPLFKCVQHDGVPSFQSAPCDPASHEVWVREVSAEPVSPPQAHTGTGSRGATRRSVASRPSSGVRGVSACVAARDAAADERERRWREITMDDLRRLDAQVERACRRR